MVEVRPLQVHIEPSARKCNKDTIVWLVPIRIRIDENDNSIRVAWACNLQKYCDCQECLYAHGVREREEKIGDENVS